ARHPNRRSGTFSRAPLPAQAILNAMQPRRVFLLSPATSSGKRAEMLRNETAHFALAMQLRAPGGAPLGDLFAFLSGLYFRGKLAYARAFAEPSAAFIITLSRGLLPLDAPADLEMLREFATIAVHA